VARKSRFHLRRNIVRCPETASEVSFKVRRRRRAYTCGKLPTGGKTEITDARVVRNINENVIWFQVSVYNAMAVNVAQAIEDLAEQTPGSINIII
jgi:hypothetical protein